MSFNPCDFYSFLKLCIVLLCYLARCKALCHATWYRLQAQSALAPSAKTAQLGCKGYVGGSVVSDPVLSPLDLPVQGNLLACGCCYSGENTMWDIATPKGKSLFLV